MGDWCPFCFWSFLINFIHNDIMCRWFIFLIWFHHRFWFLKKVHQNQALNLSCLDQIFHIILQSKHGTYSHVICFCAFWCHFWRWFGRKLVQRTNGTLHVWIKCFIDYLTKRTCHQRFFRHVLTDCIHTCGLYMLSYRCNQCFDKFNSKWSTGCRFVFLCLDEHELAQHW